MVTKCEFHEQVGGQKNGVTTTKKSLKKKVHSTKETMQYTQYFHFSSDH